MTTRMGPDIESLEPHDVVTVRYRDLDTGRIETETAFVRVNTLGSPEDTWTGSEQLVMTTSMNHDKRTVIVWSNGGIKVKSHTLDRSGRLLSWQPMEEERHEVEYPELSSP